MVNSLNSILVEGKLIADPVMEDGVCDFRIESVRTYMFGEERKTEESIFPITTRSRLAEVCGEYLKTGRGVRVVGRLRMVPEGNAEIVAEHVEFQPVRKSVPVAATA